MRALQIITDHVIILLTIDYFHCDWTFLKKKDLRTYLVQNLLLSTLFYFLWQNLTANKVHGFILVVLYIILLTTSIVIEFSQYKIHNLLLSTLCLSLI